MVLAMHKTVGADVAVSHKGAPSVKIQSALAVAAQADASTQPKVS